MAKQKDFFEKVAEKLIEKLRQGTAPWQKSWDGGTAGSLPMNPTTEKRYRGGNALFLMAQGYDDPRWMTYKQAEKEGAQVKKGEHGTPIIYWKFQEQQPVVDEHGKPVLDTQGKPKTQTVELERPRSFLSYVFNAQQIGGLPPLIEETEQRWFPEDRAEGILQNSNAHIEHRPQGRAFYRPSADSITLPLKEQFSNAEGYYSTALHELGHWTGHESRLNRDLGHPFGSEGYAREELRAEIASLMVGMEMGAYTPNVDNHAAYVGNWIKALEEDPREIFRAAADAEKIMDFVMSFELKQEQTAVLEEEVSNFEADILQRQREEAAKYGEEHVAKLAEMHDVEDRAEYLEYVAACAKTPEQQEREYQEYLNHPDTIAYRAQMEAQERERITIVVGDAETGVSHTIQFKNWEDAYNHLAGEELEEKETHEATVRAYFENRFPSVEVKSSQNADEQEHSRTYLHVPFAEKEEAKALGAKWDRKEGAWYVPQGKDAAPFEKWTATQGQAVEESARSTKKGQQQDQRVYLAVPYVERRAAKETGAKWDAVARSWFADEGADMTKMAQWLPDRRPEQVPAMSPREEFAEVLRKLNCTVEGEHPIIDGQTHRIVTEGDAQGVKSGFYVGHLDGHPAGYAKNNRSGEDVRWKSKGVSFSTEERRQLVADSAQKREERSQQVAQKQEQAAMRVWRQMDEMQPVTQPTPYLAAKGLAVHKGALTGADGKTTCLAAQDADGKIWTMQYIQEDGTKRFAKDARKEGCFHVVGGMDAVAKAPVLVISEGYATASTLTTALGHGVVAAFDAGNLESVAKALHTKYPEKAIVIAGDDDRHLVNSPIKKNPGREKAELAAQSVGGLAVFPTFASGENGRDFKDFNDLGTKSRLGNEAVARQIKPALEKACAQKRAEQVQEQQHKKQHSR